MTADLERDRNGAVTSNRLSEFSRHDLARGNRVGERLPTEGTLQRWFKEFTAVAIKAANHDPLGIE